MRLSGVFAASPKAPGVSGPATGGIAVYPCLLLAFTFRVCQHDIWRPAAFPAVLCLFSSRESRGVHREFKEKARDEVNLKIPARSQAEPLDTTSPHHPDFTCKSACHLHLLSSGWRQRAISKPMTLRCNGRRRRTCYR